MNHLRKTPTDRYLRELYRQRAVIDAEIRRVKAEQERDAVLLESIKIDMRKRFAEAFAPIDLSDPEREYDLGGEGG